MTDPAIFALAVATLLAAPGPTNALLAAAGAAGGIRTAVTLVPVVVGGYLISIGLLMSVVAPVVASQILIAVVLKVAASIWLLYCAMRLWREAERAIHAPRSQISTRRAFITTLLNPKALIFALGIIPSGSPGQVAPWLLAFSAMVCVVSLVWIAIGVVLVHSTGGLASPRHINRAAAIGLVVFAVLVGGSAMNG